MTDNIEILCTKFTVLERGALRGFADLALPDGLVIHDCMLMESGGKRWLNLPSKPRVDKDKQPLLNGDGKPIYLPIVSIPDRARSDAFRDAALAAIDVFRAPTPAPA